MKPMKEKPAVAKKHFEEKLKGRDSFGCYHLFFQNNNQNERKTEITVLFAGLRNSKGVKEVKGVRGKEMSKRFFRAAGFLLGCAAKPKAILG